MTYVQEPIKSLQKVSLKIYSWSHKHSLLPTLMSVKITAFWDFKSCSFVGWRFRSCGFLSWKAGLIIVLKRKLTAFTFRDGFQNTATPEDACVTLSHKTLKSTALPLSITNQKTCTSSIKLIKIPNALITDKLFRNADKYQSSFTASHTREHLYLRNSYLNS
jgi:hypothetical protein